MAVTTYYDSPLTGAELDAAFRRINTLDQDMDAALQSARDAAEEAARWAQQAGQTVGEATGALGWYETPAALAQAYPTASPGQWALVGTTRSLWLWSPEENAFRNTAGTLYRATFLLDGWELAGGGSVVSGEETSWSGYTQTAAVTPVDGGPAVTEDSRMVSALFCDDSIQGDAQQVLLEAASIVDKGEKTLGDGVIQCTVRGDKPTADAEVYFHVRKGGS